MAPVRVRPVRAAAIVAAVLALALGAHGGVELLAHEHADHGAVVVCALLFTLAVAAVAARPDPVGIAPTPPYRDAPQRPPVTAAVDRRARASPPVLQRFLA